MMRTFGWTATFGVLAALLAVAGHAADGDGRPPFEPGRSAFEIRVGDERIRHEVFASFVLPGAPVDVEIARHHRAGHSYRVVPDEYGSDHRGRVLTLSFAGEYMSGS